MSNLSKITTSLRPLVLVLHSHQNLSCLRSSMDYAGVIGNDTAEKLLTPLLRQLNFWCEGGIRISPNLFRKGFSYT